MKIKNIKNFRLQARWKISMRRRRAGPRRGGRVGRLTLFPCSASRGQIERNILIEKALTARS